MHYRPDAELAAIAHMLPSSDMSDLIAARDQERRWVAAAPAYSPKRTLDSTDVVIPGQAGNPPVAGRVIAARSGAPRPCLLYLHGGGYVLGSLASAENSARRIADEADVAVLTIDYRLAPEHPYRCG